MHCMRTAFSQGQAPIPYYLTTTYTNVHMQLRHNMHAAQVADDEAMRTRLIITSFCTTTRLHALPTYSHAACPNQHILWTQPCSSSMKTPIGEQSARLLPCSAGRGI